MVWMYLYDVYVCMYRMTNGRLEVRIFFYLFLFKRTILLPVEVLCPMLIVLNYRLMLLERRSHTYTRSRSMKPKFFLQKLHVCCMKMIKNILFKVISIDIYTFFPPLQKVMNATLDQATGNLLWHYLFQKTDSAIRREVGHRVIVSCFGQRNMIYKFVIKI